MSSSDTGRSLPSAEAPRYFPRVWSAPGRVNLIGEHTDYNGGLVLPFAIDLRTRVAARPREDQRLAVRSRTHPDETVILDLDDVDSGRVVGWPAYVAGVVAVLRGRGHAVVGVDVDIAGDVPEGAGLSSSAALECAVAAAVADAFELGLSNDEIASVAHSAETDMVGVPCGVMDQLVSVHARAGNALLIDCSTGAREHIPFDPASHGLDVLLVDTGVRHALADGSYAERRRWCTDAATALGVANLSALQPDDLPSALDALSDETHQRATRHVVSENARVQAAVAALREQSWPALGRLLVASHESLRADFAVSCPELDLAVDTVVAAGALGARMTGAGFGGSVVTLVPASASADVTDAVAAAYRRVGFARPRVRAVTPADGLRAEN